MCTFITLKKAHKSGNETNGQPLYREYMKGEEGSEGASPPLPPDANGMKRSQIKWKLLIFDESDFCFFLGQFTFLLSFNRAMLFIFSKIKKRVFILNQTRLSNGQT